MSGDLPRPIKGGSLHHSHGVYNGSGGTSTGEGSSSSHINVHHQHQYSPFAFAPSTFPFSLASTSTGVPTRAEFAVPVLPQRTRALVVPQSSPFGPGQAYGTVYSAPGPSSVSASKRGRRPYAGERQDAIWSPEVQEAFLQAARSIPNNGKNWIMRDGKQYGRNALIAEEIYRLTGQHRTRQQISSHIQVLKKVHADDPTMMRILNGQLDDVPPSASSGVSRPAAGTPTAPLPPSRFSSNSTSPPVMVKTEGSGSSASPPPIPNLDPIENLMSGQSLMSVIRSSAPGSVTSDMSLPGTPQSPPSTSNTDSKSEPVQIAELIPRSDVPPEPMPRALTEPLAADRPESPVQPRAWRGERLAYITAITIWAERTLKDAGVRSRPTTTHVFAQMHSASCPLEPLPADMEGIVRHIQPGTCMHAEIGIALPPAGLNVGKIRATLVIEAMKDFDGYCLTDAFCGQEGRFMSTHTTVFPTGREAREKYSWTYEVPYATEVWRKVLKENPRGAHGMRLVQKYVRGLAGGNRDGDLNVPLLVVHDIKIVPQDEVGYSRIKHIDLTGEQAKHDALGVLVRAVDDDSEEGDESSGDTDGDGDTRMEDGDGGSKRSKPTLSVAIPEKSGGERSTRANQLTRNPGSQPATPFEQVVHTPQPPPERDQQRTWMWAPTPAEGVQGEIEPKISLEDHINGFLGHALGDGRSRTAWLTRDAPALGEYAGREQQRLDVPVRMERSNGYFPMT